MIETRAWQNKMKNNLRKLLFSFDKGIFNYCFGNLDSSVIILAAAEALSR